MYWPEGFFYWPLWYWPVARLYWPWIGNVLTAKVTVAEEAILEIAIDEADLLRIAIDEADLLLLTVMDDP